MGEIARLPGARMCTTDEPDEGARLEEGLVKQITGGAPLMAKRLYKEPFEFAPEFKLWMEANHKPVIKGTDVGIWRRIMLVPFKAFITEEEKDPDLPVKLLSELPGILNWAVKGCMAWQKNGLMPPEEVVAATDEYKSEMDNLQTFLDECVEVDKSDMIQSGDFYKVYSVWCAENGLRAISSTRLSKKMQERGYQKDRTRFARYWNGLKFTDAGKSFLHLRYEGRKPYENEQESFPIKWEDLGNR
jgi:putative DNA primase/helicase